MCVHGDLRWTGIPSKLHSRLMASVPMITSGFTAVTESECWRIQNSRNLVTGQLSMDITLVSLALCQALSPDQYNIKKKLICEKENILACTFLNIIVSLTKS